MKADVVYLPNPEKSCYRHDMISLGTKRVVVCTDYLNHVNKWETMVFECRKDGSISNYMELDTDWSEEPEEIHEAMVRKWRQKLEKE